MCECKASAFQEVLANGSVIAAHYHVHTGEIEVIVLCEHSVEIRFSMRRGSYPCDEIYDAVWGDRFGGPTWP